VGAAASGQEGEAAGATTTIKVPVRRYKTLSPADVYRAAAEGFQADVRFRDAFARGTTMPEPARQIVLGDATYLVAVAFRTEGEMVCLVPRSSPDALRTLFGLPADWPLTDAVLSREMVLNPGQRITIEGTVVGRIVGESSVLVGQAVQAPTQREALLYWGRETEPRVISEPGESSIVLPCSYVEGETETLKLTVQALRPDQLQSEVARRIAEVEGLPQERKVYGEYAAGTVYRHAGSNNRLNVEFDDAVGGRLGLPLPAEIVTAPTLRGGVVMQAPIGFAFETRSRVTCLVPGDQASLMGRAVGVLPGESVHVLGTITGVQGARNCVLVDYIGFPDQEQAGEDGRTWWLSFEWPGQGRLVFWDDGLYDVPLACQHAAGMVERLRIILHEFRTVEVKAPAPAAEGQGAG
jgi:hypothetical protein